MAYFNGKKICLFYTGAAKTVIEDVSTAEDLTSKLTAANVGKVYRFTGMTTAKYTNGDLYEVVSE